MSRRHSITPTTRKVTIHTLDLVDRGKWINPDFECEFISLNITSENPEFTPMGWNGIASVTVDLEGLRKRGEKVDNPHNPEAVINHLEDIYNRYSYSVEDAAEIVENSDAEAALDWFNKNEPKRRKIVDSIPGEAVALDDSSKRYMIRFSSVLRFRNLINNKTGERFVGEDYFCLASDAPESVRKALNY